MSIEEKNKAIHRRVYEEIWNKGNLALVNEVIADEYVFHRAGTRKGKGPMSKILT
jgi:predicted SnoaL-like aldol condensation-catalyzing enzyme